MVYNDDCEAAGEIYHMTCPGIEHGPPRWEAGNFSLPSTSFNFLRLNLSI
jgi:hypothetical protein